MSTKPWPRLLAALTALLMLAACGTRVVKPVSGKAERTVMGELAGVIGHEIGHVTARHGAQRVTRQQNANLGVLAATILGVVAEIGGVGGATQVASQASQAHAAGKVASYSREQETQADQLGAEYLARNGYNPRNMIDVIAVLKRQEQFLTDQERAQGKPHSGGTSWLASHPSNDQRLADISRVAATYTGTYGDDAQARYLEAIDGLPYGDSREQGVVRGRHFFHEALGIALTAPPGWEVRNTPTAITLVNGAGDAGLIVRQAPASAGRTHDEIIRSLAQPTDGRAERRQVNGLPLTHFSGVRRDANGQPQPLRLSVVTGPGERHYLLQPAARDAAAQRAGAGIAEAEASMRAMTAADKAAARPYTLRVTSMPRGGFTELVRLSGGTQSEARLRLLNGVYGSGTEPAPGTPVKFIQ